MESFNENNTDNEYKKVAQLVSLIKRGRDWQKLFFERSLNSVVNYQMPKNTYWSIAKPHLVGSTILHIIVEEGLPIEAFEFLIQNGADFTIRNEVGETSLHKAIQKSNKDYKNRYVQSVLSAHVKFENVSNPKDKCGISHFHIACAANNVEAVKFFLKNGTAVNEIVNEDSLYMPGCNPLHFAAKYCSFEVMQILLENGADFHLTDVKGLNPLHVLIEERIKMKNKSATSGDQLHKNKGLIKLLLFKFTSSNTIDKMILSHLQVICTLQDKELVANFLQAHPIYDLNQAVSLDSPVWPGYTAAHFAGIFDTDIFHMLFKHGANIRAKNANGFTPLELSIKHNLDYWIARIELSKTCGLLHEFDGVNEVPDLIPYLHEMQKLLLSGNDVNIQLNLNETTCSATFINMPKKFKDLNKILRDPNPESTLLDELKCNTNLWSEVSEQMGMTNLHIASLLGNYRKVLSLLDIAKANVNAKISLKSPLWPGSTPLHLYFKGRFLQNKSTDSLLKLLFNRGADVTIKNGFDETPIHNAFDMWIQAKSSIDITALMSQHKDFKSNPTSVSGLSYLHIACALNDTEMVKRFCKEDVDVNQRVDYFIEKFAGYSPLQMLLCYDPGYQRSVEDTIETLLNEGNADVTITDLFDNTPIHMIDTGESLKKLLHAGADIEAKNFYGETLFMLLWERMIIKSDNKSYFMTKHIPSFEIVNMLCENGCKVNIFRPSPLNSCQEGYIGLALVSRDKLIVDTVINAASVTNLDENGRNAIHNVVSINKYFQLDVYTYDFGDDLSDNSNVDENYICYNNTDDSIHYDESFDDNNSIDNNSIDDNNLIDDNTSTNEDDYEYDSSSPYTCVIRKLISKGLDVNLIDKQGMTPLHYAMEFGNVRAIHGLIENGADINIIGTKDQLKIAHNWPNNFPNIFSHHISRLKFAELYIHEIWLGDESDKELTEYVHEDCNEELERMKKCKIGSTSIFLNKFVTDMGMTAAYCRMSKEVRDDIDNYFSSKWVFLQNKFPELSEILFRQYWKALARKDLLEDAIKSLRIRVTPCLPVECCGMIMEFLTNEDLKTLITSMSL